MLRRTIRRSAPFAGILALAACHGTQPTIEPTNATTTAELSTINAHTAATDGMDQGNAALIGTPTTGQAMDAKEQPPK
jgi:uncharacterized lipoprotein YajG